MPETKLWQWIVYEENMDGTPRFVARIHERVSAMEIARALTSNSSETYMAMFEEEWMRLTEPR